MQLSADEISQIIKQQIQNFDRTALVAETGTVLATGDGIARIHGLERSMAGGDTRNRCGRWRSPSYCIMPA